MTSISQQIKTLCDQLAAKLDEAVQRGGGGLLLDSNSNLELFRLWNNGIQMPDLDYSELQEASVSLLRVLVLRNGYVSINHDHHLLWSWLAEVINAHPDPSLSLSQEGSACALLGLAVRAALASIQPMSHDRNVHALLAGVDQLLTIHRKELWQHSHELMVYLAFPGLEAALKSACHAFVEPDGTVIASFPRQGRRKVLSQSCFFEHLGLCKSLNS